MSKKEQYTDEFGEGKKWTFWGWGILFFVVFFIALMFILEAALQPRDSFVATVIAYAIGIVGLAIFAGLVRDKSRVLITIPLLLIVVFGAGYLFHYVIEAPVYNPFAPVSERAGTVLDSFQQLNETTSLLPEGLDMESIEYFSQFAFVIDLLIALPLFIFGTLALTWFVQIFTTKPKILTILWVLFALVFFFIGLILSPFIHLLFAGIVDLGSDLLPGAIWIGEGISLFMNPDATDEDIEAAIWAFYNASEFFQQSAENLDGLRKTGILGIASVIPVFGSVFENLYHISLAALHIASGLGPFANGTFFVMEGMEEATAAFGGGFGGGMGGGIKQQPTVEINDTLFNQGIDKVNIGLLTLNDSIPFINDALDELDNVNITKMLQDFAELPYVPDDVINSTVEQIGDVTEYLELFEGAVRVIQVLVTPPTGTTSEYATLTHFLYGAYSLFKAGDYIGTSSNFTGTAELFDNAATNFTYVHNDFQDPAVRAIAESDTPILNSTVEFITDMVGLCIPLSELGSDAGVVFDGLQSSLTAFDSTSYENITNYPQLLNNLDVIRTSTGELAVDAINVDGNITMINNKANTTGYGELSDAALSFSEQIIQFDLTTNVLNADYIANGFYFMFSGLMYLSYTYGNVTLGETNFFVPDYPSALNNFQDADNSLVLSIGDFNQSIAYMDLTDAGGMVQLGTTRDTLVAIRDGLMGVQTEMDNIINILGQPDPSLFIAEFNTSVTNIFNTLDNVNSQIQDINAQ
jgi:hypothetical protein